MNIAGVDCPSGRPLGENRVCEKLEEVVFEEWKRGEIMCVFIVIFLALFSVAQKSFEFDLRAL